MHGKFCKALHSSVSHVGSMLTCVTLHINFPVEYKARRAAKSAFKKCVVFILVHIFPCYSSRFSGIAHQCHHLYS